MVKPLELLYELPLPIILTILIVLFPLGAYVGHWCGDHFAKKRLESFEGSNFVPTTILGLLALLLGFTFSMAVTRFDHRKQLVVEEANAFGTAFLRAETLPESHRQRVKENLKRYGDARLEIHRRVQTDEKERELMRTVSQLQNSIWKDITDVANRSPNPIMGLLETSMNDLFDASTAQIASMNNRVPEIVYFLIVLVTFFGISSMGFIEGAAQKRSTFGIITLSVLFAVVIVLIQDIDRPRRGLIRVGQEIYESTVQSAGENIAR